MAGNCATGLNCLKTCESGCNYDDWHRSVVGRCVNKDEAPVNMEEIYHIDKNYIKSNKPVHKCPDTFTGWNTPWNTEYSQEYSQEYPQEYPQEYTQEYPVE